MKADLFPGDEKYKKRMEVENVIISNLPILCYPHTGILRKAERWHLEGRFNHIFALCGLRIRLFVR